MGIKSGHFVGVDLGQASDFTAISVLERPESEAPALPVYRLRHVEQIPLGTPYPAVMERVLTVLKAPELRVVALVVDGTGVGRPIVDMLAEKIIPIRSRFATFVAVPVTI